MATEPKTQTVWTPDYTEDDYYADLAEIYADAYYSDLIKSCEEDRVLYKQQPREDN
jgi:hypothetical protein